MKITCLYKKRSKKSNSFHLNTEVLVSSLISPLARQVSHLAISCLNTKDYRLKTISAPYPHFPYLCHKI